MADVTLRGPHIASPTRLRRAPLAATLADALLTAEDAEQLDALGVELARWFAHRRGAGEPGAARYVTRYAFVWALVYACPGNQRGRGQPRRRLRSLARRQAKRLVARTGYRLWTA
jgi:hypothetical protein